MGTQANIGYVSERYPKISNTCPNPENAPTRCRETTPTTEQIPKRAFLVFRGIFRYFGGFFLGVVWESRIPGRGGIYSVFRGNSGSGYLGSLLQARAFSIPVPCLYRNPGQSSPRAPKQALHLTHVPRAYKRTLASTTPQSESPPPLSSIPMIPMERLHHQRLITLLTFSLLVRDSVRVRCQMMEAFLCPV